MNNIESFEAPKTKEQQTKEWCAKEFGIPVNDVVWYNAGICYSRIGVKTKRSANKVSKKVKGETVNGGMLDGMPLGGQTPDKDGGYDVMC